MRAMTDRQRECLELRLRGMKQEQIAQVLGVSQGNVSRSLRAAVKKLRGVRLGEIVVDPAILDTMDPRKIVAVL